MELDNKEIKFTITKKYINFGIIFIVLLLFISTFFYLGSILIHKFPEYTIYKACITIKNNDYEQSLKYVNIDKVTDNIISNLMQDLYNDPELKDNPFAGLAYMFAEALKSELITVIKSSYKKLVEDSDNVFQDISKPKLIYFLTIKTYKDIKLTKSSINKDKVILKFTDNNKYKDINFVLENNGHNWEIVNIKDYEFWKENENSKKVGKAF